MRFFFILCLGFVALQANAVHAAVIHPDVTPRDLSGQPVATLAQASESASCANCHDSDAIRSSLSPAHRQDPESLTQLGVIRHRLGQQSLNSGGDSGCSHCHGGSLSLNETGLISGASIRSGRAPDACASCHGEIVLHNQVPFTPSDTAQPADLASFSGALLSGQRINSSGINISDKSTRSDAFDIHLARGLVCADCHRANNRPGNKIGHSIQETKTASVHLKQDPRDVPIQDYLHRPDHTMQDSLQCTDCHRSDAGHSWLPFTQRHMSALACESCHIPALFGAALESIDLDNGEQTVRGRNQQGLIVGYAPLLLASQDKLAPFNLIAANSVDQGSSTTSILAVPVQHGVVHDSAQRECAACHRPGGLVEGSLDLGSAVPHATRRFVSPASVKAPQFDLSNGRLIARAHPDTAGCYILGADQVAWADRAGMFITSGTLLGVLLHGLARYLSFRRRGSQRETRQRIYMYSVYERFWHWLQATAILILLVTGAAIHKPYVFDFLNFAYMVELHNLVGFILLINAVFAAFYHLASGEIRQYLPGSSDLFGRMFLQARYYTQGIFRGEPHPFAKDAQHKLNPLQQITYFGLLNTLLPAQILTGILIWGAQHWPEQTAALGGLGVLSPLHSFMAWLFAAFLIMHIYLTTTSGPKPLSGIQAMLEGWEDVEKSSGGD
ncbi:Nickel-dependent hydrogenases b-type cytochrome subunit family [gamma proteobacterium NOR5-3]|nr:Nickel-dependent hydrogenases b-type cytochrome subunit family [gamma proteobacterium NOR5-3]